MRKDKHLSGDDLKRVLDQDPNRWLFEWTYRIYDVSVLLDDPRESIRYLHEEYVSHSPKGSFAALGLSNLINLAAAYSNGHITLDGWIDSVRSCTNNFLTGDYERLKREILKGDDEYRHAVDNRIRYWEKKHSDSREQGSSTQVTEKRSASTPNAAGITIVADRHLTDALVAARPPRQQLRLPPPKTRPEDALVAARPPRRQFRPTPPKTRLEPRRALPRSMQTPPNQPPPRAKDAPAKKAFQLAFERAKAAADVGGNSQQNKRGS